MGSVPRPIGAFNLEIESDSSNFPVVPSEYNSFAYGFIYFLNLVPFLKSLQTSQEETMTYLKRYESEKEKEISYKVEDSRSCQEKGVPVSYEFSINPKPTWTDNLTFLNLDLKKAKSRFLTNSLFPAQNLEYLQLNSYPSLTQVDIRDSEKEPSEFSKVLYTSLRDCKKLKGFQIEYHPPEASDNRQVSSRLRILELINEIKVNCRFRLWLYLYEADDGLEYNIRNNHITQLFVDKSKIPKNFQVSAELNSNVLEKLTCDLTSPEDFPLKLIKSYSHGLTLLDMQIYMPSTDSPWPVFESLVNELRNNRVPKLKWLSIDSNLFNSVSELESYTTTKYINCFFKKFKFGELPTTIGEAVTMFKELQSMADWEIPTEQFNEILEEARSIYLFKDFFDLYDSNNAFYSTKKINGESTMTITALYCMFAFCLIPLNTKTENEISEIRFTEYLKKTMLYDSVAKYAFEMPSLQNLTLYLRHVELEIIMTPHLQHLLRKHKELKSLEYDKDKFWGRIFCDPEINRAWANNDSWIRDVLYASLKRDFPYLIQLYLTERWRYLL